MLDFRFLVRTRAPRRIYLQMREPIRLGFAQEWVRLADLTTKRPNLVVGPDGASCTLVQPPWLAPGRTRLEKRATSMRKITAKLSVAAGFMAIGVMTNLGAQTNLTDWRLVQAITAGTQARITTGSGTVEGTLDHATNEVLVLTSATGQETLERPQVSVLFVKKANHRKRNVLIGLGVGTGGGAAIGSAAANSAYLSKSNGAMAFGAVGALTGTLIGMVVPTGSWREVYRRQ